MAVTRDDRQGGLSRKGAARAVALGALHAKRDAHKAPSWEQVYDANKRASANKLLTRVKNNDPTLRTLDPFHAFRQTLEHWGAAYGKHVAAPLAAHSRLSPKTAGISQLPFSKQIANSVNDLTDAAIYLPSGVAQLATHPLKTAKAVAVNVPKDFSPHTIKNYPDRPILDLAALVSGGATGGARIAHALSDARAAEGIGATSRAVASGLARRPTGGMREIGYRGEKTLALNSRAPLSQMGQRALDRLAGITPGGHRAIGTEGPALPLERFAKHRFQIQQQRNQRLISDVAEARAGHMLERGANPGPSDVGPLRQGIRTINRGSRAAILYGKPGYIATNLPGQEFLALSHQGLLAPARRAEASRLVGLGSRIGKEGALGPEAKARFKALAGYGAQRAGTVPGSKGRLNVLNQVDRAVNAVDEAMANATGKILDDPYRSSALVHELRAAGIKGKPQIEQALNDLAIHGRAYPGVAPGLRGSATAKYPHMLREEANARKALEAGRRSNEAMIMYDQLGKLGKTARDAIFFLPWLKGSSLYAGHYLRDLPGQAALANQLGGYGKKHTGLNFPLPSYAAGDFKVGARTMPGLGHVPLVVNPSSAGILSQSAQIAQTLEAVAGLRKSTPGIDPSNYAAPIIAAALATIYKIDPFTGQKFPGNESRASIFYHQMRDQLPEWNLYKGGALGVGHKPKSADPTRFLFPRTQRDVLNQFLFSGLAPTPVNPVEATSRYRAEQTGTSSKEAAAALRGGWFREDLLKRMNDLRRAQQLPPMKTLPREMRQAADYNQQLLVEGLKVKKMSPHAISQHGSLTTVGNLAARWRAYASTRGGFSQAQIDKVTKAILAVDPKNDAQVKAVKQAFKFLPPPMVGPLSLRSLVKYVNSAAQSRFPYANGGAPISLPSTR